MDLAEAVEFDLQMALDNIQAVRPGILVLLAAKTGTGMDAWLAMLTSPKATSVGQAIAFCGLPGRANPRQNSTLSATCP